MILLKDKILLSGGEKIPNWYIRETSSKMCNSDEICIKKGINKAFILSP